VDAGPSLYRRHRPRTFADVVGQEHVVRTLRNAIDTGQVHHAYLFVGSRGTGKTSMAKMLAACLNCERGPTTDPCGTCESCRSIAAATSLDVIEMDAASNNSVDDIRELRDSVQFAPVSGRSKVYILDEAHMLTPQAWNAFLKTLEEPPPNTVFVLATTEAHKIMDTVVDRCHRFDFHRPSVDQLTTVIARVAEQEQISISKDAVILVARGATGSYRDALGTLEQLLTYAEDQITGADVAAVLGVSDEELLFGALDAVIGRDPAAAWGVTAQLVDSGRDARRFIEDLEHHARDTLVVQTLGSVPPQLAMTEERNARLLDQATRVSGADTVRLLDLLAAATRRVKDGSDAQTQLEIALVKAASPELDPTTRALLSRLERLEQVVAGTAPSPPAAPVPAPTPTPTPAGGVTSGGIRAAEIRHTDAPAPAPNPAPDSAPASAPTTDITLDFLAELWPDVIKTVAEEHQLIASCLGEAQPTALQAKELTVTFPAEKGFQRRKAETPEARSLASGAIRTLTGVSVQLAYATGETAAADPAVQLLGEDDLLDRLRSEFDAVDDIPDPGAA
jgi:DNA polymerase-3 subunit gamma/tau